MSDVFPSSWNDRTPAEIVAPLCPRCAAALILHQPDLGLPNRLLAVCESFTAWYVSDVQGSVLTPIPVEDHRRRCRPRPLR